MIFGEFLVVLNTLEDIFISLNGKVLIGLGSTMEDVLRAQNNLEVVLLHLRKYMSSSIANPSSLDF